jgi:hypothetical protein
MSYQSLGTFSNRTSKTHIPHKGIECTKHRPTRTQRLRRVVPLSLKVRLVSRTNIQVLTKAANVTPDHGYLKHRRHS